MVHLLKISKKDLEKYEKIKGMVEGDEIDWMIEVAKLSAGKAFGELALLNDAKRAASISSLTQSYMAVISRENYQRVLK